MYTTMDGGMADGAGASSSDEAIVALSMSTSPPAATSRGAMHSAPRLQTAPSVPTTVNQSEFISQFLRAV